MRAKLGFCRGRALHPLHARAPRQVGWHRGVAGYGALVAAEPSVLHRDGSGGDAENQRPNGSFRMELLLRCRHRSRLQPNPRTNSGGITTPAPRMALWEMAGEAGVVEKAMPRRCAMEPGMHHLRQAKAKRRPLLLLFLPGDASFCGRGGHRFPAPLVKPTGGQGR